MGLIELTVKLGSGINHILSKIHAVIILYFSDASKIMIDPNMPVGFLKVLIGVRFEVRFQA